MVNHRNRLNHVLLSVLSGLRRTAGLLPKGYIQRQPELAEGYSKPSSPKEADPVNLAISPLLLGEGKNASKSVLAYA